jgi:hypothetical protein
LRKKGKNICEETISNLKSSSSALQDLYDVLQRTYKDLEVQFDAFWVSTLKPSSTPKTIKVSTSNGYKRCYNIDIDALGAKSQHFNIEQVIVKSCDEAISEENDNFKLEVKRLEQKVHILCNTLPTSTASRDPMESTSSFLKVEHKYAIKWSFSFFLMTARITYL